MTAVRAAAAPLGVLDAGDAAAGAKSAGGVVLQGRAQGGSDSVDDVVSDQNVY